MQACSQATGQTRTRRLSSIGWDKPEQTGEKEKLEALIKKRLNGNILSQEIIDLLDECARYQSGFAFEIPPLFATRDGKAAENLFRLGVITQEEYDTATAKLKKEEELLVDSGSSPE